MVRSISCYPGKVKEEGRKGAKQRRRKGVKGVGKNKKTPSRFELMSARKDGSKLQLYYLQYRSSHHVEAASKIWALEFIYIAPLTAAVVPVGSLAGNESGGPVRVREWEAGTGVGGRHGSGRQARVREAGTGPRGGRPTLG